jgi:hypothetical protein
MSNIRFASEAFEIIACVLDHRQKAALSAIRRRRRRHRDEGQRAQRRDGRSVSISKTILSFFLSVVSVTVSVLLSVLKSRWDALNRRAIRAEKKQWNSLCCPTEDGDAPRRGRIRVSSSFNLQSVLPCDDHIAICSV